VRDAPVLDAVLERGRRFARIRLEGIAVVGRREAGGMRVGRFDLDFQGIRVLQESNLIH
jgi:hypothetical protein